MPNRDSFEQIPARAVLRKKGFIWHAKLDRGHNVSGSYDFCLAEVVRQSNKRSAFFRRMQERGKVFP